LQWSRMYSDIMRVRSSAHIFIATYTETSPANAQQNARRFQPWPSREIFEFLNDDLCPFLHRISVTGNVVQHELEELLPGSRYSRSEGMLVDRGSRGPWGGTTNGLEAGSTRFPDHEVRQGTRRLTKLSDIARNVERLDAILGVVRTSRIAPVTDFHVQFPVVLVSSPLIERMHTEDDGRLQMRSVAYHESVGSVAKAARQNHMCAGPPLFLLNDPQVHCSAVVGPNIIRVIQII